MTYMIEMMFLHNVYPKLGNLTLQNVAPPQKLVLATGAVFRENTVFIVVM